MMTFRFLRPARLELREAVRYYDEQREDLGDEFLRDVRKTVTKITLHPNRWPALTKTIRRCRTDRFPYWLIYEVHNDTVIVICVMHQSRRPGNWKRRKP